MTTTTEPTVEPKVESPIPNVSHIIGCARTIQTAVLVVAYLQARLGQPQTSVQRDRISYRFKEPTAENGWWVADIIVKYEPLSLKESSQFVDLCRAFVAGRGEIWA
jgi:hypothetical protein